MALIIIAIALALLLAAVIVIGTTRRGSSVNDQPSQNTTTATQPGPPRPPSSTEPPGGDEGLSWCQVSVNGNCTLGVYQNLDSGEIRAQVYDHTCSSPTIHPSTNSNTEFPNQCVFQLTYSIKVSHLVALITYNWNPQQP